MYVVISYPRQTECSNLTETRCGQHMHDQKNNELTPSGHY